MICIGRKPHASRSRFRSITKRKSLLRELEWDGDDCVVPDSNSRINREWRRARRMELSPKSAERTKCIEMAGWFLREDRPDAQTPRPRMNRRGVLRLGPKKQLPFRELSYCFVRPRPVRRIDCMTHLFRAAGAQISRDIIRRGGILLGNYMVCDPAIQHEVGVARGWHLAVFDQITTVTGEFQSFHCIVLHASDIEIIRNVALSQILKNPVWIATTKSTFAQSATLASFSEI